MSREIYLIRHGQTDFNLQGIVQGRGVDSSLNETGQSQARAFFEAYRSANFDHIYLSSLKRTFESVKGFIDQGISYSKHKELDEIDWGTHEGKKASPESREYYRSIVTGWASGDLTMHLPEGETPLQVQERMQAFKAHFEAEAPDKSLIACHGRAMRVFLCTMLGKPLTEMDAFPHKNLTLYRLEEQGGNYKLLESNSTQHLESLS